MVIYIYKINKVIGVLCIAVYGITLHHAYVKLVR